MRDGWDGAVGSCEGVSGAEWAELLSHTHYVSPPRIPAALWCVTTWRRLCPEPAADEGVKFDDG